MRIRIVKELRRSQQHLHSSSVYATNPKHLLIVSAVQMKNFTFLLLAILASLAQQHHANAAAFLVDSGRPPIGATYEKSVGIPVLGRQIFSLHILSDNTAHLLVRGMLFLDELVTYTVTKRGCLKCNLSDNAIATMRKVRASLKEVGYDRNTDTPYVKVSTPLPMPVKIYLTRKMDESVEIVKGIGEENLMIFDGDSQ